MARISLTTLVRRLFEPEEQLKALDKVLHEWHRQNEAGRRREAVPGIGLITATAIVATVSNPDQFSSGRETAISAVFLSLAPLR